MPELARHGIETEFAREGRLSEVVDALTNQGIEAVREDYNHATRSHWKVTTDSSCGYELVSPILTEGTSKSIIPAMTAITQTGGYVNDSCGLHVHIELPDEHRSRRSATRVARFYHECFDIFSPVITERRRTGNRYARFTPDDGDAFIREVEAGRYTAVNIQCLERQPTVEFRQLQGTLNPRLAYAWAVTCDALVKEALDGASKDAFRRHLRYSIPADAATELEAQGVSL